MSNLIQTNYNNLNSYFVEIFNELEDKGYSYDSFIINDYINMSGRIDFIAHNSINLLVEKINGGFGYKNIIQDSPILLYETPHNNSATISNSPVYTSKHDWKYLQSYYAPPLNLTEIGLNFIPTEIYNPLSTYVVTPPSSIQGYTFCSAKKVELYSVPPQSLYLIHSKYMYFDIDDLDELELYGSITKMVSGEIEYSIPYNKKTNSICIGKNDILYGGLQNDNFVHIKTYDIKNFLHYEKLHFNYTEFRIPEISGSNITNDYYGGHYGNSKTKDDGGFYGFQICDIKSILTYLENPKFTIYLPYTRYTNIHQSGQNKTNWNSKNLLNTSYSFSPDSLVDVNCYLNNNISDGELLLYYCFYTGIGSGWFDFYPNGLGEVYSGLHSYSYIGNIPSETPGLPAMVQKELPIREKCNLAFNNTFATYRLTIFDFLRYEMFGRTSYLNFEYPKTPYSSGYILVSPSSDLSNIESVLNSNSPYGVKVKGDNIHNFCIHAKGNLDATELQNALNFSDFGYNFTRLHVNVVENKLHSKIDTHGIINKSGDVLWSDNHGHELLLYNVFDLSGNCISTGVYDRPNHHAEIYRVNYDRNINKNYFTGNLIRELTNKDSQNTIEISSTLNYQLNNKYCIHNESNSYTLLPYDNKLNKDITVSNFRHGTGVLEPSVLNNNTFSYQQTVLSNLNCQQTFVPSSYLNYSGAYPNIPNLSTLGTTTIISGEL